MPPLRPAGYDQVKGYGVEAYLAKAYAGDEVAFNFTSESVGGLTYDFSLTCDLAADRGEGTEGFADRISAIKRHVLAGCFFYYFETVCSGAAADKPLKIPYRHNEAIFLKKGKEDQVVVIFSVTFSDKNDWVVAEVFLREFADVRRDPALQTSPAASFSKNVPGELDGTGEEKVRLMCSLAVVRAHGSEPACSSLALPSRDRRQASTPPARAPGRPEMLPCCLAPDGEQGLHLLCALQQALERAQSRSAPGAARRMHQAPAASVMALRP